MANVLLGVTGSVAAIKTPLLFEQLGQAGHRVQIVATNSALYFFDPAAIHPQNPKAPERNPAVVRIDADEWPGAAEGRRYQMGEPVLHIELRRWAELLLIAPLDANTLAKLANGLSDNCLTCVWRAWDPNRPVVLAPAMNTLMWDHPLTVRHLRQLVEDHGPPRLERDELIAWINRHHPRLRIVPPQSKRLACGDVGMGALADLAEIMAVVNSLVVSH
ncbi:MAG: flavoprotein [Gemmataceae bacterium]